MFIKAFTRVVASLWLGGMLGCSQATPLPEAANYVPGSPTTPWTDQQLKGSGPLSLGNPGVAGMMGTGSGGSSNTGTGGAAVPPTTGGTSGGAGGSHAGGTGGSVSSGTGGSVSSGTGGTTGVPTSTMTATLDFTTKSQGGRYAPQNVGAVWITNSAGKYVKTMEAWAFIRVFFLNKWLAANPFGDRVDAVSMATLPNAGPHHSTWNMKDSTGMIAPDGEYTITIESTDYDGPGQSTSFKFTKGAMPQTVMAPDTPAFVGIKLVYK